MPIDDHVGRKDRRLDFQEAAGVEELAHAAQHPGPQSQRGPAGRGEEIAHRRGASEATLPGVSEFSTECAKS